MDKPKMNEKKMGKKGDVIELIIGIDLDPEDPMPINGKDSQGDNWREMCVRVLCHFNAEADEDMSDKEIIALVDKVCGQMEDDDEEDDEPEKDSFDKARERPKPARRKPQFDEEDDDEPEEKENDDDRPPVRNFSKKAGFAPKYNAPKFNAPKEDDSEEKAFPREGKTPGFSNDGRGGGRDNVFGNEEDEESRKKRW